MHTVAAFAASYAEVDPRTTILFKNTAPEELILVRNDVVLCLTLPDPALSESWPVYVHRVIKENIHVNRREFLHASNWRWLGFNRSSNRAYYSTFKFDHPCRTFTQTEAWSIEMRLLAFEAYPQQFPLRQYWLENLQAVNLHVPYKNKEQK